MIHGALILSEVESIHLWLNFWFVHHAPFDLKWFLQYYHVWAVLPQDGCSRLHCESQIASGYVVLPCLFKDGSES